VGTLREPVGTREPWGHGSRGDTEEPVGKPVGTQARGDTRNRKPVGTRAIRGGCR